jgi:hypothetical protein
MNDAEATLALTAALNLGFPGVLVTDPAGFTLGTVGLRCTTVEDYDRGTHEVAPRRGHPTPAASALEAAAIAVAVWGAEPCARAARRMLGE